MTRIHLSRHAIERYRERVKPAFDLDACEAELERLVLMSEEAVEELDWEHDTGERADCYLILSDGIALALVHSSDRGFLAKTCLTRCGHSEQGKRFRNRRRRARRRFSQDRARGQDRDKRKYDRKRAA